VKPIKIQEINPKTNRPYYYKDNPKAAAKRNKERMYIKGKYVKKEHILQRPGNYKSFQEAAFESLPKYSKTIEGYVYILSNPAWEGWYKVGMAADINDRVSSFQTSSPLRDYKLEHSVFVTDRKKTEAKVHSALSKIADEKTNEWFNLALPVIIEILNTYKDQHEQVT
jgi:hypothetical protein